MKVSIKSSSDSSEGRAYIQSCYGEKVVTL